MFNKNHIHFDSVDSTNKFTISLKNSSIFQEGLLVTTNYQSSGKGQIGRNWESERKKNVLFSIVLEPNIRLHEQFDLIRLISMAICDLLDCLGINAKIKWPNDIIVKSKKIAGILIQNIVSNQIVSYSVVGVGININQTIFQHYSPLATSLKIILKNNQSCLDIRNKLLKKIENRVLQYRQGKQEAEEYNNMLFLKDKKVTFQHNKEQFRGLIRGVDSDGLLEVERNNNLQQFHSREIKLLI